MSYKTTLVDLIRHGEPVGGRRYRGQIDDPLSDKGWEQMRRAVNGKCPWQHIITSPLCRCQDFAQELAERHETPLRVEAGFKEIGFGDWEGRDAQDIRNEDPDQLMRFYQDPIVNRPQGAEPLVEFERRVIAAWQRLLTEHQGQHVLVVGHAGTIRMIVRHILQMPLSSMFRISVANAGLTRIQVEQTQQGDFPRLLFHGGELPA